MGNNSTSQEFHAMRANFFRYLHRMNTSLSRRHPSVVMGISAAVAWMLNGTCVGGEPAGPVTTVTQWSNSFPTVTSIKGVALLLAAIGIVYVLVVMSLQLSCWFALVEATFKRCASLALILVIPITLAWLVMLWMLWGVRSASEIDQGRLIAVLVIWPLALLTCGYWTRRMLDCRWRSVVTICVMFNLSSNIMMLLAASMALVVAFGFNFFLVG